MTFVLKSFYFTIWVKGILSKYIGAWLLAEGAVILSGNITYYVTSKNSNMNRRIFDLKPRESTQFLFVFPL